MTFSSSQRCGIVALGWLLASTPVLAEGALGEFHSAPRAVAFSARPSVNSAQSNAVANGGTALPFSVAEETRPDGSRIRRYLASNGQVFAVSWRTLYKPDLSSLLGASFPDYEKEAINAAKRGGIQRQFQMGSAHLVLHSTGHLHVFSGLAYKPSLLPPGVTAQVLGWS